MKKYPFLDCIVIISIFAFFCVSCNGNKSSQDQPIDIKVTPEIALIGTDSLIVHNLHLMRDSSEVLVKMAIPYERNVEKEYDGVPLSPQKFTGNWYKMKFKEKINGYNLTVTVYPSDSTNIEDFHFSSETINRIISISILFNVSILLIFLNFNGKGKRFDGEIFTLNICRRV